MFVSSGLWPFATLGWPNEEHNMKSDLAKYYPGDVLETGYDILFFWVARMVTMGLELTGKAPFKVVYLHGLVRDGQGQKMSKTKGNVIDPIDTISQFGTDALRYSLVTGSTPGQDVPLSLERVESNRNFANKLWNVGKYVQHALSSTSCGVSREELIVGRLMTKEEIDGLLLPERFIVSKVHKLIDVVSSHLDRYEFGEAGKALYDFLWDDLADWYIEASKTHTRHEDLQVQKSTFKVLVYAWDIYLRLLHPYMPYVTETLWQNVPHSEESLMVATWPSFSNDASNAAPTYVDEDALKLFNKFQNLIRSIRNVRAQYNVDPGRKISILVQSSSEVLTKVLNEEAKALIMLARIEEEGLEFIPWSSGANQDKIDVAKAFHDKGPFIHLIVEDGLEAYLPQSGLLDKEKELARLNKQSEKLQKEISGLEGRLTNKSFVEKAPENLVKEAKDKLSDLQVQLAAIHKSIDSLSSIQ